MYLMGDPKDEDDNVGNFGATQRKRVRQQYTGNTREAREVVGKNKQGAAFFVVARLTRVMSGTTLRGRIFTFNVCADVVERTRQC